MALVLPERNPRYSKMLQLLTICTGKVYYFPFYFILHVLIYVLCSILFCVILLAFPILKVFLIIRNAQHEIDTATTTLLILLLLLYKENIRT